MPIATDEEVLELTKKIEEVIKKRCADLWGQEIQPMHILGVQDELNALVEGKDFCVDLSGIKRVTGFEVTICQYDKKLLIANPILVKVEEAAECL